MMPDETDFAAFWKSHELAIAVTRSAIRFLCDQIDYDGFRYEVKCLHDLHCVPLPDNVRPPRPRLRLVMTGD